MLIWLPERKVISQSIYNLQNTCIRIRFISQNPAVYSPTPQDTFQVHM